MADQLSGSELTEEHYKLALELERIFMPHAHRQRAAAGFGDIETADPIRFVHYTSAEAALKIIQSKRLWMRNATCMADYREVEHGLDIIREFFSDPVRRDGFFLGLDRCHTGIAEEVIKLVEPKLHDFQFETYIASISEHDEKEDVHGRLSM